MKTPSCPQMLTEAEEAIPVKNLSIVCEIHISTAFITIQGVFVNNKGPGNRLLVVPMEEGATITKAEIRVRDRLVETIVLPTEDAKNLVVTRKDKNNQVSPGGFGDIESFIPTIFRLPIANVLANDELSVEVTYFEPLHCEHSEYLLTVASIIPNGMFLQPTPVQQILSITCHINTGTPHCRWGSSSHPLVTLAQESTRITLEADKAQPWENVPFKINYSINTPEILCNILIEPVPDSFDANGNQESNFVATITPPVAEQGVTTFSRNIVFLVDRSMSMDGEPMQAATAALHSALDNLKLIDKFAIVQFNHQMDAYSPNLLQATPYNVSAAKSWLGKIYADGGTDILSPVKAAIELLKLHTDAIPFLFLVTDGCVQNEREICQQVNQMAANIRIFTFGIGPFCNTFFLKMLSQISRGYCSTALQCSSIYPKMLTLIQMAEEPILSDISIGIDASVVGCEIYPFPIPDLFCGGALVISGKFFGVPPSSMVIRGRYPNGQQYFESVPTQASLAIPIGKIFAKQRIDLLTARAWFEQNDKVRKQVVELSCTMQMPSAHTSFVAYETTPAKYAMGQDQMAQNPNKGKTSNAKRNVFLVGLTSVGAVVLVGATLASFGDIASTFANTGVGEVMANFAGLGAGGLDGDLADLCGDCDKIGACCQAFGDNISAVFDGC